MKKTTGRKTKSGREVVILRGGLAPGGAAGEGRVTIMRLPVKRIRAAAYNPRKDLRPGDAEWEKLAKSIDAFGYVDPLIWNKRTGNLVGGHQRFKVLLARGAKHVDVSVVELSPPREKALNVALNHVKGQWDDEGLAKLLGELQLDKSIDATLTGFSAEELTAIVDEGEQLVEMLVPGEEGKTQNAKGETQNGEEEGGGGGGKSVAESWQVVVECKGEREQKRLFEKLSKEGWKCKVLTM